MAAQRAAYYLEWRERSSMRFKLSILMRSESQSGKVSPTFASVKKVFFRPRRNVGSSRLDNFVALTRDENASETFKKDWKRPVGNYGPKPGPYRHLPLGSARC
jgi:hypothetical protein